MKSDLNKAGTTTARSYVSDTAAQIALYVSAVFEPGDIVEIRCVRDHGESAFYSAAELSAQADNLASKNHLGWHIYVGVNPRKYHGGKSAKDVLLARVLFADFDGCTLDDVMNRLNKPGLPSPTMIIASGHGYHMYWRLAEPIEQLADWTKLQKGIIKLLGTDKVHDAPRIMRLPGFQNVKAEPFVQCNIIECEPSRRYVLADLSPLLLAQLDEEPVENVIESAECHSSAVSVCSAVSTLSAVSAISALSITPYTPEEVIRMTLPARPGERNAKLLCLSRGLKFNCGLKDTPKKELKPFVQLWFDDALRVITTKDFDETWSDFLHSFKRAELPLFDLRQVLQSVDMDNLPAIASIFNAPKTKRLIGFCWALANLHPQRRFFLSTYDIADLIPGFYPMSAWRMLRMFEVENIIKCLDPGDEYNAARFYWIGG